MREKVHGLLLLVFCAAALQAQDLHFSQFNEQTSLVNPALTGVDNPMKATLSYKNQWQSVTVPYVSYGASFETRLKPGNWEQVDKFRSMTFKERGVGRLAFGLSVFRDKAGDGNMDLTQGNLSIATFIPTGKKSFLSLGLQGSVSQRRLNGQSLIFPNQYNGTYYDPGMSSNENLQGLSSVYAEASAGLVWSYKHRLPLSSRDNIKANVGFSAYHLNQPKQSYLAGADDHLHPKYVLYGDFLFAKPNRHVAFMPRMLMQIQGSSFEAVAGIMIRYYADASSKYTGITKSSSFGYGIYYRNNDAIIANLLFELKEQYAIGLSYDVNISGLSGASSGRGGLELMLRYTPPGAFLYQMKKKAEPVQNGK